MSYPNILPQSHRRDGFIPFPQEDIESSIPARFEQQVERYPNNTAIKQGGHVLTYKKLNETANRLANIIVEHLGEENVPVAHIVRHGNWQIIASMGILKAGKISVALDNSFPEPRLEYMLRDSHTQIIVTDPQNLSAASKIAPPGCQVLNIGDIDTSTQTSNPGVDIHPHSLALLQYTSGSTGKPKGVLISHRNLLQDIRQQTNRRYYSPEDRMVLLFSVSFGASTCPIFSALLNGAQLHPFDVRTGSLQSLASLIGDEHITIYYSVPSFFRVFASSLTVEKGFPSLRLVMVGGETVLRRDVQLFKRCFSDNCVFEVVFGGTEFHEACTYLIFKDTEITSGSVPVGYPIEGKTILLADESGNPVPEGESGEIIIQSHFISPGYWKRPDLTQAAITPVAGQDGWYQYKTGDLGRLHPDGYLEHLGRKDFQVKIRGHRVELAEVTSALLDLKGIEDAAVTARTSPSGDQILVAYLKTGGLQRDATSQIKHNLGKVLPEYMLPSQFVFLDEFPRTPTGKTDIQSLPDPSSSIRLERGEPTKATNPLEEKLVAIWEKAFGQHPIGIRDDFQDLGGHSLLGLKIIADVESQFGTKIDFPDFIQARTIEKLAKLLQGKGAQRIGKYVVALQPKGSRPPFFCVPPSAVTPMFFNTLARHLGDQWPFYSFEYKGMDGQDEPHDNIREMARTFIQDIKAIQPVGPYFLSWMCLGGTVAFEMAHQLCAANEKVAFLGVLDTTHAPRSSKNLNYYLYVITRFLNQKVFKMQDPVDRLLRRRGGAQIDFNDPISRRLHYVFQVHRHAQITYFSPPYPGKVTIFNTEGRMGEYSKKTWEKAVSGELEAYLIPGYHKTPFEELKEGQIPFTEEPHVQVLSNRLLNCLEAAYRAT